MPKSTSQPGSGAGDGVGSIVADINALIAQTEALLEESTSQHAVAKLDVMRAGQWEEQLADWQRQFRRVTDRLAKTLERADRAARAYPYHAAVFALLAGVVVGRTLARHRG